MRFKLAWLALLALPSAAQAHEPKYFYVEDFFEKGPGVDRSAIELTPEQLAPGLHVLYASGGNVGNVLVSTGEDGTLIVDSMYAPVVPKIQKMVADLGANKIDFVINTHSHFDHADGNPILARSGSHIIAHSNARLSMTKENRINFVKFGFIQPPYPKDTLPVMTFDKDMQFHFNGDTIKLMYFGPAHTNGDAVVYFERANLIHMGDVFNNDGYPFIDTQNGGDIDGMIDVCKKVLAVIDEDTTILPGHGTTLTYNHLAHHIAMLETVRDQIKAMIESGLSLEQVQAAKPTKDFDQKYSHGTIASDPALFVDRVYVNLKAQLAETE